MSETQEAIQRTEAEIRQLAAVIEAKNNAISLLKNHPATDAKVCQALTGIFGVLGGEVQAHQQRGQQLQDELQMLRSQDGKATVKKARRKKRARALKAVEPKDAPVQGDEKA